ncbi:MAG: ankyrin repeat domain-containing protein [Lentisphaeria bacterium]|nr:ankyrin repeat domain-containing protein [Lentisphaeria bacterium]NQZ67721.1 ankyrin repeat domain-containing protein [Lentisphaeria bacterium]
MSEIEKSSFMVRQADRLYRLFRFAVKNYFITLAVFISCALISGALYRRHISSEFQKLMVQRMFMVNRPYTTTYTPAQGHIIILNKANEISKSWFFDVNSKDEYERTLLHIAVFLEGATHMELAKRLIKRGADVNAKSKWGSRPLQLAVMGKPEIVALLLENGANINDIDPHSMTLLQRATPPFIQNSNNDQLDIVKLLLEAGIKINAKNERGQTVLDTFFIPPIPPAPPPQVGEVIKKPRLISPFEKDIKERIEIRDYLIFKGAKKSAELDSQEK